MVVIRVGHNGRHRAVEHVGEANKNAHAPATTPTLEMGVPVVNALGAHRKPGYAIHIDALVCIYCIQQYDSKQDSYHGQMIGK